MNRREFIKGSLVLAGAAAIFNLGCAKEPAAENDNHNVTTREVTTKKGNA